MKSSVGSVKKEQFYKYTKNDNKKFVNLKQKKVVLYIDKPMGTLNSRNAKELEDIKAMGVTVVNSLEELKEVIEAWEHPVSY